MNPVLNDLRCLLKGFIALIFIMGMARMAGAAEAVTVTAGVAQWVSPSARNIITATIDDGIDVYSAPLHWSAQEWGLAGLSAGTLAALVCTDTRIYALRSDQGWLDASMPIATDVGDALYAVPATALLWGAGEAFGEQRLADTSSSAMEGLAFVGVASVTFKYAFAGDRPAVNPNSRRLFDYSYPGGSPSFPSGHTLVAFSLAEVYGDAYGRWWTYPLAATVGYSRIYLGQHWPSDVVAGALLGALLGRGAELADRAHGYPRSWKFSFVPNDSNGGMLVAQRSY